MKKIFFVFCVTFLSFHKIYAQVGSTSLTCIWSGALADCLPSSGILLRNQRQVRFGEASGSGTNYIAIQSPTTLGSDVTLTLPTNDGDLSQWLVTDGSGALSFTNTTTTGKTIDGVSDEVQLTIQGNSTQTNNILTVEKSDSTDLLVVNNTNAEIVVKTNSTDGTCGVSNVCSGTYTPTITNGANVASSTAYQSQYMRVGSVVTVSGMVDITATADVLTQTVFEISLPIASNLAASQDLAGSGSRSSVAGNEATTISAEATNNRASCSFRATSTAASRTLTYTFTYEIL